VIGVLILLKLLKTDANIEHLKLTFNEFDVIIKSMLVSTRDLAEKESQILELLNRFTQLAIVRNEFQQDIFTKLWEKTLYLSRLITEKEGVQLKMTVACTIGCLKGLIHAQRPSIQGGEWLISLLKIIFKQETLEKIHVSANKVVEEGNKPFYPEKEHDVSNIGVPVFDLVLNYLLLMFTKNPLEKWDTFVFTTAIVDLTDLQQEKVISDLARESFTYASCTNWPIDEPNEYVQVYKLQEMTLVGSLFNICRRLKQYVVWFVRIWQ
jgi:hypothetical protein